MIKTDFQNIDVFFVSLDRSLIVPNMENTQENLPPEFKRKRSNTWMLGITMTFSVIKREN